MKAAFGSVLLAMATAADLPPECNITAVTMIFQSVIMSISQCQVASGYAFLPPQSMPTDTSIAAICAAPECKPIIPFVAQIPSCSIGPVDLGAFGAAINNKCGNGTSTTTAPPTNEKSSVQHASTICAVVVIAVAAHIM